MAGSGYAGGSVLGGLGDLIEQLRNAGQGGKAESWVSPGRNEPIDAREMEQALGPDLIERLSTQTGLDLVSQEALGAGSTQSPLFGSLGVRVGALRSATFGVGMDNACALGGDGGHTDSGDLPQAADITGKGVGRRDPH